MFKKALTLAFSATLALSQSDALAAKDQCSRALMSRRAELVDFAKDGDWQGYTFVDSHGQDMPVLAFEKKDLKAYLKDFGDSTIGLIANRKKLHGYIRVGRVIFDIWDYIDFVPEVRARSYEKIMETSKSTRWYEAVMQLQESDIKWVQWFYLYRAAIFEQAKDLADNEKTNNPWYRKFTDRGRSIDPCEIENCSSFVMSPFLDVFHDAIPSAEQERALKPLVAKEAAEAGVRGAAPSIAKLVAELRKITKKYDLHFAKTPQGLMRLAHVNKNTLGYLIHNVDKKKEDFVRENKMGFQAMKDDGTAESDVIDDKVRDRTPIKEE